MKYDREYWSALDEDYDDYEEIREYRSLTSSDYYSDEEEEEEKDDYSISNLDFSVISHHLYEKGFTDIGCYGLHIEAKKKEHRKLIKLKVTKSFLPDEWWFTWRCSHKKTQHKDFKSFSEAMEFIDADKVC